MNTSFKSLEEAQVVRHRLQFETESGFKEALRLCTKQGFLLFRNEEKPDTLVGRLVRINREKLIIEVDAAPDMEP